MAREREGERERAGGEEVEKGGGLERGPAICIFQSSTADAAKRTKLTFHIGPSVITGRVDCP